MDLTSAPHLDEGVIRQRVDVQVEAEPKETGEESAHQHSETQVVAQGQTLAKYPAAESKVKSWGYSGVKTHTAGVKSCGPTHTHT